MKCFKIIDLAKALLNYYKKKGNKKSKIIFSQKNKGENLKKNYF